MCREQIGVKMMENSEEGSRSVQVREDDGVVACPTGEERSDRLERYFEYKKTRWFSKSEESPNAGMVFLQCAF